MKANYQNTIDTLAYQACTLMTEEQRASFFAASKVSPVYVKGENKGKEREVFEVDGTVFNKLWSAIYPYVYTSSRKSSYYNDYQDVEDNIEEVKYLLFRYLRFFGPAYQGQSLSKHLPLLVNNVLTNQFNKNTKQIETTPFELVVEGSEDDTETFSSGVNKFQVAEGLKELERTEILSAVPTHLQRAVELLMQGSKITEVAQELGVCSKELRNQLQTQFIAYKAV